MRNKTKKKQNNYSPDVILQIAEMYKDGNYTVSEIAEEVGLEYANVTYIATYLRQKGYAIQKISKRTTGFGKYKLAMANFK